jgi:hypothetical protein
VTPLAVATICHDTFPGFALMQLPSSDETVEMKMRDFIALTVSRGSKKTPSSTRWSGPDQHQVFSHVRTGGD